MKPALPERIKYLASLFTKEGRIKFIAEQTSKIEKIVNNLEETIMIDETLEELRIAGVEDENLTREVNSFFRDNLDIITNLVKYFVIGIPLSWINVANPVLAFLYLVDTYRLHKDMPESNIAKFHMNKWTMALTIPGGAYGYGISCFFNLMTPYQRKFFRYSVAKVYSQKMLDEDERAPFLQNKIYNIFYREPFNIVSEAKFYWRLFRGGG